MILLSNGGDHLSNAHHKTIKLSYEQKTYQVIVIEYFNAIDRRFVNRGNVSEYAVRLLKS